MRATGTGNRVLESDRWGGDRGQRPAHMSLADPRKGQVLG